MGITPNGQAAICLKAPGGSARSRFAVMEGIDYSEFIFSHVASHGNISLGVTLGVASAFYDEDILTRTLRADSTDDHTIFNG